MEAPEATDAGGVTWTLDRVDGFLDGRWVLCYKQPRQLGFAMVCLEESMRQLLDRLDREHPAYDRHAIIESLRAFARAARPSVSRGTETTPP